MKPILIAFALCLVLLPFAASAQDTTAQAAPAPAAPAKSKHTLGANVELSIPTGEFADVAGTGIGGNLKYQYFAMPEGALTLTAGYLSWEEKALSSLTALKTSAFNFMIGGKFFITEGFYGSVEGGLYFLDYNFTGPVVDQVGKTDRFMLPIGIGYEKSGFEAGARYMLLDTELPSFSITLGYNFGL
jgi:hypothetical protein